MKLRKYKQSACRDGVAAVELAILLPFLVGLLIGIWEVGRMVEVKQILTNAAREGGRQASAGQKSVSEIKDVVIRYLQQHGITASASEITCVNLTNADRAPTAAVQLDEFQITVTIPFSRVQWVVLDRITSLENLVGEAEWFSMRDIAITVDDDIPLQ